MEPGGTFRSDEDREAFDQRMDQIDAIDATTGDTDATTGDEAGDTFSQRQGPRSIRSAPRAAGALAAVEDDEHENALDQLHRLELEEIREQARFRNSDSGRLERCCELLERIASELEKRRG